MSDCNTESHGSCLCGAIRYTVTGELRPVVACHCRQCQKTSGSYVMATQCQNTQLQIQGDTLKWFKSSDTAERGFCSECGSNLFWHRFDKDYTSLFAGALEQPSGLTMASQIHADCKADYYPLPDVPQIQQSELS